MDRKKITPRKTDLNKRADKEGQLKLTERLNLATHAAQMGIWDWDIQKDQLVWDDQMYRLYGLESGAFGGAYEAWLNGVYPEDRISSNEASQMALHGEKEYDTEFRVLWPDGSIHWLKANGQVFRDQEGNPIRMVGVNYDITGRKQIEERLKESEEYLRLGYEAGNLGIWRNNLQSGTIEFDERARIHYGFDTSHTTLLEVTNRIHPDDLARVASEIQSATSPDASGKFNTEYRVVHTDGSIHWLAIDVQVMFEGEGTQRHAVLGYGTTQNITERKHAEDALKESEARFSKVFFTNPVSQSIISSSSGQIVEVNDACCRLYEYKREELIGTNPENLDLWANPDDQLGILDELQSTGRLLPREIMIRPKSGEIRTILFSIEQTIWKGEPCLISSSIDISERKQAELALRKSEEKYRELINGMNDTIWVIDFDTTILDVNTVATTVLGYTREEMLSMKVADIDHNIDPEQIQQLATSMSISGSQVFESKHTTKDGRNIPVEVSSSLVTYMGKTAIMSIARDISDRKQSEQAIKDSENRLKSMLETAMDAIVSTDQDQRIVLFNAAAEQMFGVSSKEALGQTISRFIPDRLHDYHHQQMLDITPDIARQIPANKVFSVKGLRANGEEFPAESAISYVESNGEKIFTAILRDITERQKADQALRESEERLRLTLQTTSDGFWIVGTNRRFIEVNEAYCLMSGYTREEFLQLSISDIEANESIEETQSRIKKILETGAARFETHHRRKDGSIFDVEVSVNLLDREKGLLICFCRDTTERKRAETLLNQRLEDLALINKLNNAVNHGESLINITELLAQDAKEIFGSQSASIYLLDHDKKRLLLQHYTMSSETITRLEKLIGRPTPQIDLPIGGDDHFSRVLESDNGFLISGFEDISAWLADFTNTRFLPAKVQPLLRKLIPAAVKLLNINSVVTIPLKSGGEVIGVIEFIAEGEFTEGTLERLRNFRHQLTEVVIRKRAEEALRESEEKYRSLAEASDALVVMMDEDGRVHYLNEKAAHIQGFISKDVLGKTLHELLPKEIADLNLERVQQVISKNQSLLVELPINDGTTWYRASIQPIHDINGRAVKVLLSAVDISELKAAQQNLLELNSTLEARVEERTTEVLDLYNNAPNGYHSLDVNGKIIMINQTELNWLGYTREEVVGIKSFQDLITQSSQKIFAENFQIFKKQGWISNLIFEMIRKNGSTFPVLLNASAIQDEHGKFIMSRSTLIDITQRKQSEDALRESQARLQYFFDTASDLIQSMDENGKYQYVNNAWCQTLGYTTEEALHLSMFDVIDESHHEHCRSLLKLLTTNQQPQQLELLFKTKSGDTVIVEGSVGSRKDLNGHIATNGIFRNITERKKAETALRESRDELGFANAALEKASRLKDEFLASMSHELRTPLTGILGLTESLQLNTYGHLNERQSNALKNIEASGRHLLELINDILDLSKIESSKFDIYPEMINIEETCQASLTFVKEQATKKSIRLEYQDTKDAKSVFADSRRLKQILVNLLSNAVKFTPDKGRVTLSVRTDPEKGQIHFAVADTGIGIAKEDLGRLFTPFTQVDSRLNRQYEGTGLGLALVLRLTEMHGGNVQVETEPGQGSCFTVSLPWQSQVAPPVTTHQPYIELPAKSEPNTRSVILLAEDNTSNIESIGDYLQFKGHTLVVASNGVEALLKAKESNPNLILMDIQMPVMDGLETMRRLRADPRFTSTPIIALTALAMAGDRERCMEAGASDYLSKPVSLKELAEKVERLLQP